MGALRMSTTIRKKLFFVDTNIIIAYRKNQYMFLKPFIEQPDHKFFYTDTVLSELKAAGKSKALNYPESEETDNSNKQFEFIASKIPQERKDLAINLLYEMWSDTFGNKPHTIQQGLGLNEHQLRHFKQDLSIIFEAGFCVADIINIENPSFPALITNNMKLVTKFLSKKSTEDLLEQAINLAGLEHLIEVNLLENCIEAWQAETTGD